MKIDLYIPVEEHKKGNRLGGLPVGGLLID